MIQSFRLVVSQAMFTVGLCDLVPYHHTHHFDSGIFGASGIVGAGLNTTYEELQASECTSNSIVEDVCFIDA